MKKFALLVTVAAVCMAAPAFAVVVTFQDGVAGYAGTSDAHIVSWDGNQNQLTRKADGTNGGNGTATATTGGHPQNTGSWTHLEEGDYGATKPLMNDSKAILIKFDLAGIKGQVKSAKIGLYYWYERSLGTATAGLVASNINTEKSGKKNPHTIHVNRILKNWAEGTSTTGGGVDGDDAADNSGEVTWNSTGTELWQAIGAEGPEDIAPTESHTNFDPAVGGWVWFDVTESAKIWLADPSKNFGVKLGQEPYPNAFLAPDLTLPNGKVVYKGSPTATPGDYVPGAYDFISSENTKTDLRPKLELDLLSSSTSAVDFDWSLFK